MQIDGFLNINKPVGPTSHDVVRTLKRLLNKSFKHKIGHTGTLDPSAKGVLVIGIGRANRLAEYILLHPKEYSGIVNLGKTTDTLDADGKVVETCGIPEFNSNQLDSIIKDLSGEIMQIPPVVSALKKDGERYYVKARRGEMFEPDARPVNVYNMNLKQLDEERIELYVKSSSGFYVRSLARDIAVKLGTIGYLSNLIRLSVGPFRIEDSIDIDWIEEHGYEETFENHLYPVHAPMDILPRLDIPESENGFFSQGMKRRIDDSSLPLSTDIAIFSNGVLSGIGRIVESENGLILIPRKVIV